MPLREIGARLALGLAIALAALASTPPALATPPSQQPGPRVDRLLFKAFDVDRAALDLKQGRMDLYLFGLKTAAAVAARADPQMAVYEAPATTISIVLNPAPAPGGELNPFSIREVRWALQLLVNREAVASQVYRGMAQPMVTHLSPTDFDQLTLYDLARGSGIRYDPELARGLIRQAMERAGARLESGVWSYQGTPIRLKFIIRIEDERREVGDLLRAELEKAGFLVTPIYQQFAPAILSVYSTDPRAFQWHLYTEGWGRSSPDRYDFALLNQMAAPWMGNMPGWREAGFWQYESPELDALGKRIFTGQFSSKQGRDDLYRQAAKMALDESVRIWVATVVNSFPASTRLEGVTEDLVAGPRSPWTLREAAVPGQSQLTVGNLWVWTERTTWNPIGGMIDVYSTDIWRNLHDPPVWSHPFSGLPMPVRASYQTESAGPFGKLAVPADAFLLDPVADAWRPVGQGIQATSKVTFDYSSYFESKWHHGQPITMADVLYSIYQGFDLAYDPEKSRIELALAATSRPFLDTFRGFRVLGEDRLEVYVDFWHFQEEYIASYASPSGLSMPWEVLAAMDALVFERRQAAYSDTAAARFDVPWLSLVMDRHVRMVRTVLQDFQRQGLVPAGVFQVGGRSLVDPAAAGERYRAALDWATRYGLLVVSNGPFMLTRYDPPAQFAQLDAFRDPSYPFSPGQWQFGRPERVELSPVGAQALEIGVENRLAVRATGPGRVGVHYLLLDPAEGRVVDSGEAEATGGGGFEVRLAPEVGRSLEPGLYQLFLAAYSDAVSAITERRVDLDAAPPAPETPSPTPAPAPTEPTPTPVPETTGGVCGRGGAPEVGFLLGAVGLAGLVLARRRRGG